MIRPAKILHAFLTSERAGGVVLMACTGLSLILTNTPWGGSYTALWQTNLLGQPAVHWINDGLMAIFFLLIGLELKRELTNGELSSVPKAMLPVVAALGGMAVPALIYSLLNFGTPLHVGAGIPMATDIAFSLAVLSLLGKRVPVALKVFLTAFAVIDDLGAVVVIALFYRGAMAWLYLLGAAGITILLVAINKLGENKISTYLVLGVFLWICMVHSGIHAALAGVILAFTIPAGGEKMPAPRLERFLAWPVAFIVLPLFALANTCLQLSGSWYHSLGSASSLGIMLGLVIGKPVGIITASYLAVKSRLCRLPSGVNRSSMAGIGMLGGIGFTMSIFITLLAFREPILIDSAKMAVLVGSLISGVAGYLWLNKLGHRHPGQSVKADHN